MALDDFLSKFETGSGGAGFFEPASSNDFLSGFEDNQHKDYDNEYNYGRDNNEWRGADDFLSEFEDNTSPIIEEPKQAERSEQEAAEQANGGQSYLETAISNTTGEEPKKDVLAAFENTDKTEAQQKFDDANFLQKLWMTAKGIDRQAYNQFMGGLSGTAASLLGEGTIADKIYKAIAGQDATNPVSQWNEARQKRTALDQQEFGQMVEGNKGWEAVNKYGTMAWSQAPSAMLSIMMAPISATAGATTAGLEYASSLAQSTGLQKFATMAAHGLGEMVKDPQFILSYSQEAGNAYNSALKDGATPQQASLYASLYGTFSAMIETGGADEALGGMQNYPKAVQDAVKNRDAKTAAVEFAKSIMGEIGEEWQQGGLENLLKRGYGKDTPWYSTEDPDAVINPKQMLETAKDTAITTALLQGGQHAAMSGINAAQNKLYNAVTNNNTEQNATEQEAEKPTVPVPDSRKFVRENATETPAVQQEEITQPIQQEEAQAPSVELNSNPDVDTRTAEQLEAEERAANAGEPEPKGWQKTLQNATEKTEAAQKKAAEQPAPEQPQPLRKVKPYTENEKILAEDRKRLDRENKSLRKQVENLSKQTKRTEVKTARESDVKKAAREIVKAYESKADIGETTVKMQQLADYLVQHTGETIDYDEVQRMAEDIAMDIVDNIKTDTTDEYSKERAAAIKEAIKNNAINFGQLAAQYSMEDAKSDFPVFNFKQTKGMSIQDFYDMLVNDGLVEPNVNGAYEQLSVIKDALDAGNPNIQQVYANDANYDQAVNETANEILDTLLSDAVRESEPTFADKQAAKLDATKAKMQQQIDAEKAARKADRQESRERLNQFRKEAAQSKKEAVAKERAERYKDNQRYQEQYRKMREREANKRETKALRDKIKALHKDLAKRAEKGGENHYVPEELMGAVVDLLESVNTDTGSVSSAEKLSKLYARLNELKSDPDYNIEMDDFNIDMLDHLSEVIGGTPLNEMNKAQLEETLKVMKAISDQVKEGVKVNFRNEEHQASEFSKGLAEETKAAKDWGKLGKLNAIYTGSFGRAMTYLERLGGFKKNSFWSQVGERLNEGQKKASAWAVKTAQRFDSLVKDKRSSTMRDTVKLWTDAEGHDVEISRGMIPYIKMLLDSEDGMRHLKYGGATIPGIKDYYSGKNDGGFGTSRQRAFGISPELSKAQEEYNKILKEYKKIDSESDKTTAEWESKIDDVVARLDAKEAEIDEIYAKGEDYISELKDIIDKNITDYERQWIKTFREELDESQKALNDTTMDIYHYKKATVKDYVPIITDPNFRKANFESISRDMSLENSGFMKARTKAANPILILDISEVVSDYSQKVANYTGIMPAVRDFQKVYGKTGKGFKNSLQDELDAKFGKNASKYIEDLVADLQGARRGSDNEIVKALGKVRGNMAKAVLTLNPRVAMSQSASYLNAAAEIGYKPLAKALSMGTNPMKDAKVMELITKYSPLLYYRTLGNTNAVATDIHADASWQHRAEKKFNWLLGWINTVDQRTVGRLWYASEAYVQQNNSDLKAGTDEYYQEVAKVFDRVVEKTQPNSTTMQKAAILRDPSEMIKAFTPFMTQRLQNQNILYEAGERLMKYEADFKNGENGVTEADVKQARKDMFNAASSQILSAAMLVAIKGGVDALMHNFKGYRDKDKELNAESIRAKLLSMYTDALTGSILGGSELYSLYNGLLKGARYDGLTLNGVSTLSDTLSDIVKAANAKPENQLDKTWKVVEDFSKVFGISLENAEKIVNAVWKHGVDAVNGDLGTFESDLSEGPIDKMTKVDFGYEPMTTMFSPLYNAVTRSSDSKDVAKEIQRLYESTGISGVYPNIRNVSKLTINDEEYDLTGKDGQKYRETAGKAAEQFAKSLMDSKAYQEMTDDQKAQALKTLYGYAKDLAKDEFIKDHDIETDSVTTAMSLLKGIDKPGEANDKTALNEKNLADYVSYTTVLKDNIKEGNYKEIDKLVGWYSTMNKNMQTVLYERNSDLKRLLEYNKIGENSEAYFKMKESIIQSQINLDQSANTSAYVRLYALADCDIPESTKRNIAKNLMQGDDKFIGSNGKAAFNALTDRGFSIAQVAQFFDIALHCKTWKESGEAVDVNGTIKNDAAAFAIMQLPGLTEAERAAIYNAIRSQVNNKNNDWGTYSYKSEVKWLTNPKNKVSYSTGIKINDKRSYQTSDALWDAYLSNAS